jgi:hypothetical protein
MVRWRVEVVDRMHAALGLQQEILSASGLGSGNRGAPNDRSKALQAQRIVNVARSNYLARCHAQWAPACWILAKGLFLLSLYYCGLGDCDQYYRFRALAIEASKAATASGANKAFKEEFLKIEAAICLNDTKLYMATGGDPTLVPKSSHGAGKAADSDEG